MGAFVFDIWVPRGNEQGSSGYQGKYFQALQEEEEEDNGNMGFVGLDECL